MIYLEKFDGRDQLEFLENSMPELNQAIDCTGFICVWQGKKVGNPLMLPPEELLKNSELLIWPYKLDKFM
jgi:hypothetical protein